MAKEAREIITYHEEQLSGSKDKAKGLKLGVLHLLRVAVDHAEKLGALTPSLPQFSRTTELTQVKIEPTEALVTDKERLMADLGLTPKQVATHPNQVNDNTKAYLGSLVNYDKSGIIPVFKLIGHLEHIYTDYPEAQIPVIDLKIGGVPKEKLPQHLKDKGFRVSRYAEDMIRSEAFTTTEGDPQPIRLFKAPIGALGFRQATSTRDIYSRIDALGADLCPAEVGPRLREHDANQPMNDIYWIAMKQIAGSDGHPNVFALGRRRGVFWLSGYWADPDSGWLPGDPVVFSLRK